MDSQDNESKDEVGHNNRTPFQLPGAQADNKDDASEYEVASSLAVNYSEHDFSERDPEELDDFDDEDDENNQAGDESSEVQDSDNFREELPYPGTHIQREADPDLPNTVTLLNMHDGGKVYLVGTAHFSESSQEDVAKTIQATKPDIVLIELCNSRINILQLDEKTLLEEAKNINFSKMQLAIKQSGLIQGVMHLLLLSMSAHLTKELGMAPGGEFRRACREAQRIPGCRIHLGDRPIQITLRRAIGSLSWWQKIRLAWYMITSKDPISKEDVERCKQKDLLEEMLKEMTGEFPALSEVFVKERDLFLTNSLRMAARPVPHHDPHIGTIPAVVVGVVGIGHMPGITENWENDIDIRQLMTVPPGSAVGSVCKWTVRAAMVGLLSWSCFKAFKFTTKFVSKS